MLTLSKDAIAIFNVPLWISDRGSRPVEEIKGEQFKKGDNGDGIQGLVGISGLKGSAILK